MNFFKSFESLILKIIAFLGWFFNSTIFKVLLYLIAAYILFKVYLGIRAIMLGNIVYKREFSEEGVYEGDSIIMTEIVYNKSYFPLFWVDIEAYYFSELKLKGYENIKRGDMQHFVSRFNLMPYMQIRRRHQVTCEARGFYQLKTASIYNKTFNIYFDSPIEIYVYPKPAPLDIYDIATGRLQGELVSRRRIYMEPFSFSGIREYHFGDPMSQINFKASARSPVGMGGTISLKVNNRDFCATRRLMIFLDINRPINAELLEAEYHDLVEQGLSYACSIVSDGIFAGFAIGFATNCRGIDGSYFLRIECESGEPHMLEILKAMALIRPREGMAFSSLLEKEIGYFLTNIEYVIFSIDTDEKVSSQISALESMGNSVKIITLHKQEDD
ncbi:MAG: DUF58 domain-containing protein, partial [Saccharofermentanales bacterium]